MSRAAHRCSGRDGSIRLLAGTFAGAPGHEAVLGSRPIGGQAFARAMRERDAVARS